MRALLLLSFLIACGSSSKKPIEPAVVEQATPDAAPAPPAPAKATFPGAPDTLAGEHLAWILTAITSGGVVEQAEAERRLHAKFLAQVPAAKFVEVTKSLAGFAPVKITSVTGSDLSLVAKLETAQGPLVAIVEVDGATKQIAGMLFRPDAAKPKSFDEALAMTAKLGPRAQLLVAELDKGQCKPLHTTKSKDALAIGSTFKLYVLLGLVDKIIAGKAKWEDELAVRDDWKSVPSGITQNDPAGTKMSLKTFAERMISISDNTATDHLLYSLGRKQVEAALQSAKHATPARNRPFFSTREITLFKLDLTDDEIAKYLAMPEAKRRLYLDKALAGKHPDVTKAAAWTTARRIEQFEWFASTEDLCRVMGTLWQRAQKPAGKPLLDVLAIKPNIELDKAAWSYVGAKGGSEPGVINYTWLAQRADGKWFVVAVTANAPEGVVDAAAAKGVAQGVFELLAKP